MKSMAIDLEIGINVDYVLHHAQHGGIPDPSWDAYVEVNAVKINGEEIYLDDKTIERIEEIILKKETE